MAKAIPLTNAVRTYAWGSRTFLPQLLGEPVPADEPWAEIWIGAHQDDPSRLPDGRSLAELEPGLPFLVKLLAARDPLSIQAHPSLDQAGSGYAAEEAAGIPRSAAHRSYKDSNHKPELLVALTRTEALCGFRAPNEILATADRLGSTRLHELVASLRAVGSDSDSLRQTLTALLSCDGDALTALLADVTSACAPAAADPGSSDHRIATWVLRLVELYPADRGVLGPLFLRLIELEPGEGLYIAAGVLHSYLAGAGVEIQASSDNVLRGGLTAKHVDVAELLRVVTFGVEPEGRVLPRPVGPRLDAYDVPVSDFNVWRVRPDGGPVEVPAHGPRIVVCVEGDVEVGGTHLRPGAAAYVPAEVSPLAVGGFGCCFVTASAFPDHLLRHVDL